MDEEVEDDAVSEKQNEKSINNIENYSADVGTMDK